MRRAVASDIATCMYYTGIDPFTKQEVYIARGLRDRRMQRALMQFFQPENRRGGRGRNRIQAHDLIPYWTDRAAVSESSRTFGRFVHW